MNSIHKSHVLPQSNNSQFCCKSILTIRYLLGILQMINPIMYHELNPGGCYHVELLSGVNEFSPR